MFQINRLLFLFLLWLDFPYEMMCGFELDFIDLPLLLESTANFKVVDLFFFCFGRLLNAVPNVWCDHIRSHVLVSQQMINIALENGFN